MMMTSNFTIFDAVVDRPDRDRQIRTPSQQREARKSTKDIRWKDDLA
jgi:hypothetical protein